MRHDEILGLVPRLRFGVDDSPGLWLFVFELLFWAIVILLTVILVRFRPKFLERAEALVRATSQHRPMWLVAFPLAVISIRVALLPLIPVPVPVVHDEFSYLLASDTFADGRLTNPPSPMWEHFESFHINVRPTYQSMYPPGQGLALALGQKLTGVPWVGVLVSTAIMCSAIYWMLLGWLPAPWAWLGGAFACVRFGIFSYWMNSYWGGAVAAIGGALVLGALPRFRKERNAQNALMLAAGLLILANSRPLEGFLFSLPIVISVAVFAFKSGWMNWRRTVKALVPAAALLAVGAAGMLYYNWRGTGNPLVMPYSVNFKEYHISPPFFFQKAHPVPQYRHASMRAFYVPHEFPDLLRLQYASGYLYLLSLKADVYYAFFLWPFLLFLGPCFSVMWRSELRVVLFSFALLAADLFAQTWRPHAHYVAPAAGAIILALLFGLRHFRNSQFTFAIWASRALVIVIGVWMLSPIAEVIRDPFGASPRALGGEKSERKAIALPLQITRQRIQSDLLARGGKHLVIVRYPFYDYPAQEWVYNEADIEHARVVWARDMGYLDNQKLVDYFPDRQVWYVDHVEEVPLILPYEQVSAPLKLAYQESALHGDSARAPSAAQPMLCVITGTAPAGRDAIPSHLTVKTTP